MTTLDLRAIYQEWCAMTGMQGIVQGLQDDLDARVKLRLELDVEIDALQFLIEAGQARMNGQLASREEEKAPVAMEDRTYPINPFAGRGQPT